MNLQFSFYENDVRLYDARLCNVRLCDVRLYDVRLYDVRLYDVRLYDAAYIFKIYPSESKSCTLIYAHLSVQNAPALQSKS